MPDHSGLGNPCDEQGNFLQCDASGCMAVARFRRTLPPKSHTDTTGLVYVLGYRGPRDARPRSGVEVVCGQHYPDWRYGPVTFEEHG